MKLRITILKYPSCYLCQISLQIMLLPTLIKSVSFYSKSENLKISKGKTNKQTFKQKLRVVSLFGEKIAYRLLRPLILPLLGFPWSPQLRIKSVNHSRTVVSMRETGWGQQQFKQQEVRLRSDSTMWSEYSLLVLLVIGLLSAVTNFLPRWCGAYVFLSSGLAFVITWGFILR